MSDTASNEEAKELAERVGGGWMASSGISYRGETVVMEVYSAEKGLIRFVDEDNEYVELTDEGVYLCLRLEGDAKAGDTIEISPYGSEEVYSVKVAGILRSVLTENIVMTDGYAESIGIPYHISSIYTAESSEAIEDSALIEGKQDKQTIMDTYDSFMDIMVLMFVLGAVILGIMVLYNLGVMSYVERSRELATLKVVTMPGGPGTKGNESHLVSFSYVAFLIFIYPCLLYSIPEDISTLQSTV